MTLLLSAPPIKSSIAEEQKTAFGTVWLITSIWENYFRSLVERLQAAAHTDQDVALTGQSATIAATALVSAASAGVYRVSTYLQQTIAAATSASLQVTIRWTSNGINLSKAGAALTTNTTSTHEELPSFLVAADPGTNITYELAYASNPASAAQYMLNVNAEAMG